MWHSLDVTNSGLSFCSWDKAALIRVMRFIFSESTTIVLKTWTVLFINRIQHLVIYDAVVNSLLKKLLKV